MPIATFFALSSLFGGNTDTFAIFDDTDTTLSTPVVQFGNTATVGFTALTSGNGWTVDTGSQSGTLQGSSNFRIGWSSGSTWFTEVGAQLLAPNSYAMAFVDNANMRMLLAFDIKPSAMDASVPAAVPLPASIWLMASALATLLYSGRRGMA